MNDVFVEVEQSGDESERGVGPAAGKDNGARLVTFLSQLRGLGHLDPEALDKQLNARRFELLRVRAASSLRFDDGSEEGLLPDSLPSHREIHDAVLGGKIPKVHQMVAHVLYPAQVSWPQSDDFARTSESSPSRASQPRSAGAAGVAGSGAIRSSDGVRSSQNATPREKANSQDMLAESEERKKELDKGHLWLQRKRSAANNAVSSSQQQRSKSSGKSPRSGGVEVTLRGQRLNSTIKGYACAPMVDDSEAPAVPSNENSAKERIAMEREAKLEEYRERKVLEKIKELEALRQGELELQESMHKKEEKRRQRSEALKSKIEVGYGKKFEQEEAERKEAEQRKEEQKAALEKRRHYHEAQKNKLADWWAMRNEAEFNGEPMSARKPSHEKALAIPRELTAKQREAVEETRRQKKAMEERPPLPPMCPMPKAKAHDLQGPPAVLTDRDLKKPKPISWEVTAKAVSGAYGLSKKEYTNVTERTLKGIHGAGRMAAYDL